MVENACPWEEISSFDSRSEFEAFRTYLEKQIHENVVVEVEGNPDYQRDMVYGGRWFKYLPTGEIWRLVDPDFPYRGAWEPVDENFSNKSWNY